MTRLLRLPALLLVLCCTVVVASCSSSDDDVAANEPDGSNAEGVATQEGDGPSEQAGGSSGNDVDVCSLLTWEEVEEWTGFPRAADSPEENDGFFGTRSCIWVTEPDPEGFESRSVILTVATTTEENTARQYAENTIELIREETVVDTAGIPGEVFSTDGLGSGTIVDDDLVVIGDTTGTGGDPTADTTEEEQQVQFDAVRAALGRLGAG